MTQPTPFNLIVVSAQFEHGGNCFHRHLDSHPNLFVYMGESQMGPQFSRNVMCPSIHPVRYGYPEFPEGTTYERAFDLMWDEECKAYLRCPQRSKFKDCGVWMSEEKRRKAFLRHCRDFVPYDSPTETFVDKPFSRAQVIEAYFRSFFDAWENLNRSGNETHYTGYVPGMVAETDKFFSDFSTGHIIHIVRNPFSAYADYLKRPFPQQTLEEYCLAYNLGHHFAVNYAVKYPGRFHLVKLEDFFADKRGVLEPILAQIGLPWSDNCLYPSFNGRDISENMYPWGTVEKPTTEYNHAAALSLPLDIKTRIAAECALLIKTFNYESYGQ